MKENFNFAISAAVMNEKRQSKKTIDFSPEIVKLSHIKKQFAEYNIIVEW